MTVAELLVRLHQMGVKVEPQDGRLRLRAPAGTLSEALRAEVASQRDEILAFLTARSAARVDEPALERVARDPDLPLSFAQQRLWFLDRLAPGNAFYNQPLAWRLRGPVDFSAVQRALHLIVSQHEVLRTRFPLRQASPVQVVETRPHPDMARIDLRRLAATERWAEARRQMGTETRRPFDLAQGPMIRSLWIQLADDDTAWNLTLHHIVIDGWSIEVLQRQLATFYDALRADRPVSMPELPFQYADFSVWQRRWLVGERLERQLAYWRQQLTGVQDLELPTDRPRPAVQSFRGRSQRFHWPEALATDLERLSRGHATTLYITLLAAFEAWLHRLTGQADVTVGAPIANRDRPELEELIGCFANIQVQRSRITGDPCFEQVLEQTKATAVTAYDHQDLPFEKLVEHLRLPRDLSRNPLFQVIFTLQSSLESELVLSGLTVEPIRPESQTTHLDLELSLARTAGSFHGVLIYATDLFDDTTIQRFGQQIRTLFAAATRETARPLSQMPLLTAPQRHQLRVEWNDTAATGATEGVEQLFEAQASRSPEAIAATCGDEHLSFGELARRARALARRLRRLGVGPEVIVGVGLERSLRVLEAIFGILRSGGAYLPLDPSYPPQRLRFMLDDARVPLVLTETRLVSLFGQGSWRFLPLDAEANDGTDRSLPELPVTPPTRDPRRLAYVIYTSGSTGRPKGVLVSHPSLVNFLGSMRRCPGLAPGDVLAAVTPLSFDIAGLELLLPILVGARLVLVERQVAVDGFALAAQLAASSANALQATPATWRLLTAVGWQPPPGFAVLCGGEALPAELATELIAPGAALWNLYGPTETTVWSTCERLAAPGAVTIGRPIARTSIHLLDRWLRPVVPGAIGELCIGGRGLARGYLRRPARSAEVFLPDPWSGEPGGRLYRSGDLARYASEGRLLCLGRIDHQVKLRGRRLELGEIETVLAQDPAVTAAVVVVREKQPGDPRLIAYVELRQPSDDWAERLRSELRRQLPGDMVPALFLPVESWPLSPAGKIDRRALRQRPWPRSTAGQTVVRGQPQSDLEKTLAAIWCEILGRDAVGMEENFFDLGGHSLLLVEVRQRLIEALGREISIVDLFRYPNLRSLVRLLAPHDEADTEPSPRGVPQPADASEPPSANESPAACIAIIGMAGRFPGAETVGQFWHNLCAGVESISFFSDEELLAEGYSAEMLRRPECIKARGTIDGIDLFDAKFFGFTRRDAEITDPQQRLFLETAYSALEDAGHPPEHCQKPVGVFAGASRNSYFPRFAADEDLRRNVGDYPLAIGNDVDFLATRIAYKLDLKGPSVTLQTACSTSLVAVHFACESLRRGECDMALAGGVGLEVPVKRASLHQAGGILARDGHCRAFDARAAGTVAGQGLGIVVLKRLVEAQRDGDSIRAVILGSAINNDGADKVGYTAPSVDGQAAVIEAALAAAHVEPATIGYVEAHGTGTKLGDPLEVAALQQAFASVPPDHRCALGSVKTNIGHLDTAAGVAGLIKASLAVENGFLPPSLHCQQPNPEIDFAAGPFRVNQQPRPWASAPQPRRAGVSSFGIGGTNVHMVLEEPPPIPPADAGRARQLLVLSGRTLESLQRSAARLADHLETAPDTDLADAAYTLQVGRRAFGHRRVLVCAERDAAIRALRAPAATGLAGETPGARRRSVAFLFPGQGVQRLDMGRQLYRSEAVFRRHVDRCAELFEPCLGLDLRHLLFPNGEDRDEAAQRLNQTRYSQPALFTVELALARLWMAWGVVPSAMIGHSLGEYTAAVVAETLALPEAAAVVAERGRMMHALPAGAMLTVPLGSEELTPLLGADLELAAFNAPARTVVSGQLAAVTALERRLAARKVPARRLETAHAFHSAMVEPIVEDLARVMRQVDLREPRIPWVSNVTGTWITAEEATDPTYWSRHLRQPVRFAEALEQLVGDEPPLLLEVGPGRSLTALARRHAAIGPADAIPSFPVKRGVDEIEAMLQALGQLWLAGTEVDWQRLHAEAPRRRISLPPTPFERQRYWIDPQPVPPTRDSSAAALEQTVAQHVEVLSQQLETLRRSLPAVPTNGAVRQQETPAPPQRAERQLGAAAAPPPPRSFGPWRPPASTPSRALNGHQRRHLEALIERYVRRTAESKRRTSEQRPVLADVRASMGFRQPWKELVYPITARRSAGSRLWDIDGNEYLDLVMGFGVNLFGHSPPFITRAIAEQLERGVHLGPQSDLAGEVATAIRELTGCQRVTFCNTGSEAVTIALRLARTATGRSRIAWFDGSYHGLADSVLGRPQGSGSHRRIVPAALGIPTSMVADSLVLDYAQEASLEILERHAGEVAAVLVEPVQAGRPACDPSEFLQQLRQLTERLGIALIFDEMITGFRIHPGGAQAYFGVEADLATYGKVVGGGLPIGVIAGRRDFMDAVDGGFWDYGDDSYPHVPQTFVAGTFCKHPLALAAARATLQHLRQEGPALQQRLDEQSAALTAELDALFAARGLPLHMERFASLFYFRLPKELAFADLFQYFMLEQGIHLWGSLRCFLSTAHQPADLEQIVAAASATLAKMEEGGFLEPAEEPSATSPRQERQGTETSPTPSIDVAQTLDTAQTLAQIWSTLLGVEEVGPDDDFFALGGDSLMAIQAVDMARRSGIALSQFQMVDHPRLADLARVAQGTEGSDSGESDVIDTGGDEAPASGPVPLMPYQDYFLAEIDTPNPHHWNVTVLYAVPRRFDRAALARAVESLVHRHDALRLRFIPQGDRWQQVYSEASDAIPLSVIDLGRVAEGGRRSALETAADQAQRSLLLGQGPTVRFVYFELADSKRDRLLFVAHHLVIDNISVDILIDDLQTAYARLERGQTPDLPATTASFQAWAERLAGYAQAPVLEAELGYWLGLPWSQTGRLPVDLPAGENTTLSGQTVELTISQPKTTILLRHVTRRFTVKPEEIFLTALLLALVRWTGRPEHVIGLLHHGREPLFEDLDVSRTVGGFNSHYQVVLGLDDTDDIAQALQSVSSQRRQIPHNGLGFGVLRHLSRDLETVDRLKALPPADVFFNYEGQVTTTPAESESLLTVAQEAPGRFAPPLSHRPALLFVAGLVVDGALRFRLGYSDNAHHRSTIERLADRLREALGSLARLCSPTDLPDLTATGAVAAPTGSPEHPSEASEVAGA